MKFILFSLVVLLAIWSTQAYQCYECDSASQPGCNDPFNKGEIGDAFKVEAKPNERCQKAKITGAIVSRSLIDVASCPGGDNKCVTVDVPVFGKTTTCCCNSDLCNGVSSVRQQPFVLFTIISILSIVVYRCF